MAWRVISGAVFSASITFGADVPASGADDSVASNHAVVTAVGICQKHLVVILEEILRSVAP